MPFASTEPSSEHIQPSITIFSPLRSCPNIWGNSLEMGPHLGVPRRDAPWMEPWSSSRVSTSFFLAQGLEVEQMATYEDITPFRDVKAKWTVGEHPGEE